jgi:ABC-2 type transport system permease protein
VPERGRGRRPVDGRAAPPAQPAGVRHLLGPKWRIARARATSVGEAQRARALVLVAIGAGFFAAAYAVAARVLVYFRSAEDIGGILAGKVLSLLLLAFSSILLLSNVVGALSTTFLARDLDQVAAAPVPARALYGARLVETGVHANWMVVLLLLPLLSAYGIVYQGGPAFVGFALLVFAPFFALPTALGALLTLVLANVFPARRTRDFLSVVVVLAIAALAVLFRMARPEQLVKPEGFANFMDFVAALDAPTAPWLPSEWAGDAVMAFLRGGPWQGELLRLWGAAAGLVLAGYAAHRALWARGFSAAQEGTSRHAGAHERPLVDRLFAFLPAHRRELVAKELKVFARDTTQWSQLILLFVLLVVYVANIRYLPLSGEGVTALLRQLVPFLNLAIAGFVLASVAARFVFPSVSLEGRALWLLRSSPLAMRDLLWAKFWVGAVPLFVLALVLVIATNLLLDVSAFVHVVSTGAIAALVFPLTAMALSFGAFYPQYDAENAAQIPTSFGGLLFMLSAIGLIGVVAWGTGRPAARWVFADHFGRSFDNAHLLLPFALVATLCAACTVLPLRMARRKLEALERG